jgi:hypothetical protein
MGFYKRYVSREALVLVYQSEGISGVKEWMTKPDALIFREDCIELTDVEDFNIIETVILEWITSRGDDRAEA